MQPQGGPVQNAAMKAAHELEGVHFNKVDELLKEAGLYEEGVDFSDAWLEAKGYVITQIMLPDNQYKLILAKIEKRVQYKAELAINLEVSDMPDTTLEDNAERRAERADEAPAEAQTPAPETPAESEGDDKKDAE